MEYFLITQNTSEINICLMIKPHFAYPTAQNVLGSKKAGYFKKLAKHMSDIGEDDSEMIYSSLYGAIDEEVDADKSRH